MANSMTGYGRAEVSAEGRKFTTEIKSVNNRYLDLNIRLPRQLNPFEAKIREELKKTIHRGKVDVYILSLIHISEPTRQAEENHPSR